MTSTDEPVGAELARARQAAGLSLEEAARQLKFAPRQLDALERGELARLPGGAAVRGMVRSYARLLRLDPESLVTRIAARTEVQDAERLAQRFRQPVPFSDGSRRSNVAYIGLSAALLAVVAAVALEWRQERKDARLSFVAAAQQPAEPARIALASAAPAGAPASLPQPQPASVPAPGVRVAARAEPGAGEAGQRRLVLQFEKESWVEIHSGTGKLLVSQLHAPGSERVVSGVPPFSVVIGNAQHVRLTYNEKPVDLMPHVKVEVARFTLE
jgi:cytoskeleton protein RodZ